MSENVKTCRKAQVVTHSTTMKATQSLCKSQTCAYFKQLEEGEGKVNKPPNNTVFLIRRLHNASLLSKL
jgi:hypothetical protein